MALFDRKFHVSQVLLYKRPGPLTSTGKGPQELDLQYAAAAAESIFLATSMYLGGPLH